MTEAELAFLLSNALTKTLDETLDEIELWPGQDTERVAESIAHRLLPIISPFLLRNPS